MAKSEKTFSFKDSLRESTRNREHDMHHDDQAKAKYRPYPTQKQQVFGPSYQNNYYYNFNNNFNGIPLQSISPGSNFHSSHEDGQRHVRFAQEADKSKFEDSDMEVSSNNTQELEEAYESDKEDGSNT